MAETNIRLCSSEDIVRVMDFIERCWKSGHIMARDRKLMDFQHRNEDGGYNFYIAEEASNIIGILGFIPISHYDEALTAEKAVWPAIWKNVGAAGVGLALFDALCEKFNFVGSIGINAKVAKLYRALGFQLGELKQYYILNNEVSDFKIAALNAPQTVIRCTKGGESEFRNLGADELLSLKLKSDYRPLKTGRYFVNRYLRHPYYKYQILGVIGRGRTEIEAILSIRAIDANGSRCLRIVDVLGDLASCGCLANPLQKLMCEENAEYVDCLNYGLPEEVFRGHGFAAVDAEHVIPNYFEPFVRENTVIRFAVLNKTPYPFVVFKGDSDQDRPNTIPVGAK